MASLKSILAYQYRKKTHANRDLKKQLEISNHGKTEDMIPPMELIRNYVIYRKEFEKRSLYELEIHRSEEKPVLLYLHGGAFLTGLNKKHWTFLDKILSVTKCPVVVPDYPLIPEYTHKKIVSYCMDVYRDLLERCPHGVILMGDSAGAALAMEIGQCSVKEGIQKPKGILLLSPFLDATKNNPVRNVLVPKDPILEPEGMSNAALLYAGSAELSDPSVSPVYGTMKGLPKIYTWTGTNDMLYADALLLKEKLHQEKVPYHVYTYPDMIHNWMFENYRESRTAIKQMIKVIRTIVS